MTVKAMARQVKNARRQIKGTYAKASGGFKALVAGAAGMALMIGKLGGSLKDTAADLKSAVRKKQKKSREVIEVKKSTLFAIFMVLAAVAGALGALYFYVLRREKELDEYEQLLFSEEFDDDPADDADDADADAIEDTDASEDA